MRYAVATPGEHFVVSLAYSTNTLTTGMCDVITFRNAGAAIIASLRVLPNGSLYIEDSTGATVTTSAGPVLTGEAWMFVEVSIDSSAGNFIVRVNDAAGTGTPLFNATSSNMIGTIALIGFGEQTAGAPCWIDDVFIRDTSGSTNNGFLGDRRFNLLLLLTYFVRSYCRCRAMKDLARRRR